MKFLVLGIFFIPSAVTEAVTFQCDPIDGGYCSYEDLDNFYGKVRSNFQLKYLI